MVLTLVILKQRALVVINALSLKARQATCTSTTTQKCRWRPHGRPEMNRFDLLIHFHDTFFVTQSLGDMKIPTEEMGGCMPGVVASHAPKSAGGHAKDSPNCNSGSSSLRP